MSQLLPDTTVRQLRKKRRKVQEIVTSVKLSKEMYAALQREAERQQRSQSWLIREALVSYLSFRRGRFK